MVGEELDLGPGELAGRDLRGMLEVAVERGRQRGGDDAGMDLDDLEKYFVYYKEMYNAVRSYRIEGQSVPVTLFLSSQHVEEEPRDPTLGLEGLAKAGLEVVVLPGRHDEILQEPAVAVLASHLDRRLVGGRGGVPEPRSTGSGKQ